jgi:asparagine synthase (glutamine-hydrolysing)
MCGIAAIFAYNEGRGVDRDELRRIRDHMTTRGPDGYGEWYSGDNRVGLGHRRLAIIDLSDSGAQPMHTEDGRHFVSFNGEIYNYQALRSGLQARGYRFRSTSDTEVLLHLYAEKGPEMLNYLRGMFAFVIWDNVKRELFLARDPFGIKPLYFSDDGKTFRVASQVKALLAGGKIDTSPEPAGHVGFFLWGHVPEPYTMYKGVRSLPAGSFMSIDKTGQRSLNSYCSIPRIIAETEESMSDYSKRGVREPLRDALLDSVGHHLIADVPVGVFLSAGMDSSTLVALASEINRSRLNTVTLGFREYIDTHDDETPLATVVADRYGTDHRTIWVSREDFHTDIDQMLGRMDQPTTDGVNSYFVSKAAVKAGLKVAISGLGGDELFGSYPSFTEVPRMVKMFGPAKDIPILGKAFRVISAPFLKYRISPKYAGLLEYGCSYEGAYLLRRGMFMPWELPKLLDGEIVREGWQELQTLLRLEQTHNCINGSNLKVSTLEMCWYMRNQLLRDTDWASMAHSLEVRVPLVDIALLRKLVPFLKMSSPPDKRDLASTPVEPLPHEIINRGKTGFSVPVRQWLMGDLGATGERGLRDWAKFIYRRWMNDDERPAVSVNKRKIHYLPKTTVKPIRILALVPDAFGGHGGIALYNRDILSALCRHPDCSGVVAIPRLMPNPGEPLPAGLTFVTDGIGSKKRYIRTVFRILRKDRNFDIILCGHINLLPLAYLVRLWLKIPVLLEIYGIDAWKPTHSPLANYLARKVDWYVSISDATRSRFLRWTGPSRHRGFLLPNAIHMELYGPGEKDQALLDRYGLKNKTVLMTLGRMVESERYKGVDVLIELLPELSERIPDIAYLIVGDGTDKQRLEEKAKDIGVADKAIFAGLIPEEEKAAHYRLADVYAMPSQGEGFGFVFLEAMACGVPVVASKIDGSREAVREGKLGILVDPSNRKEIISGIIAALNQPRGVVPEGLQFFSFSNFEKRLHKIISDLIADNGVREEKYYRSNTHG